MFPTVLVQSNVLMLLSGAAMMGGCCHLLWRRAALRQAFATEKRVQAERAAGRHLCFSTLEALAYAIEASDSYSTGHLECVQRCVEALTRALNLPEPEAAALRAAALLHNIGRLGVPSLILHKPNALTPEEQEKLRAHPVLGARILASIPFPWPVIPLVRHHAEHWDGTGYPDGLKGSEIPLGARILAVANAYSALRRPRPFRVAFSPTVALEEIEARSGTQFDPGVVAAFRVVASQLRAEAEGNAPHPEQANSDFTGTEATKTDSMPTDQALTGRAPKPRAQNAKLAARAALDDIAAAQRETLGLFTLAQMVCGSLHLEDVADRLLTCTRHIVPCAACVLFLPDAKGEFLYAHAAQGANARFLLGSLARIGTYLTGRAFTRAEMIRATYLGEDLILRDVSDLWTSFRSTLIVPLLVNGQCVGTINLYHEEPDAFGPDAQRVMRLVATQASWAVENARRYDEVKETAYTDPMTGLPNARSLREFLEREINRASREELPLAVLLMDLDNFKPINDKLGHARGDQTLREVAEILNGRIRNYDLAARYAGDEFVVVLARTGRIAAENVAAKLRTAVEKHVHRLMAREPEFPPLGLSIGIALYPDDGQDAQSLLCCSDAAMYVNKRQRKSGRTAGDDERQAA